MEELKDYLDISSSAPPTSVEAKPARVAKEVMAMALPEAAMRELVLGWLIHHSHPETAQALLREMAEEDKFLSSLKPVGAKPPPAADASEDPKAMDTRPDITRPDPTPPKSPASPAGGLSTALAAAGPGSRVLPARELESMARRRHLCDRIRGGDAAGAAEELAAVDGGALLRSHRGLHLELLCLHFVSRAAAQDHLGALRYARDHLLPFVEADRGDGGGRAAELERLQDCLSLLAYDDPAAAPGGGLLGPTAREAAAAAANGALVAAAGRPEVPALESVIRQAAAVRDRLVAEATGGAAPASGRMSAPAALPPPPRFTLEAYVRKYVV